METYAADDEDTQMKHATRLIGVHSALDGTSKESVKSWKNLLKDITNVYNQSPLGQHAGHLLLTAINSETKVWDQRLRVHG